MALQITTTASTGYEVRDAYVKITGYTCGINNLVHARLCAYVSKELADAGASHIEGSEDIITLTCDYGDDASNTKKQIYEYAKTLDKFADAVDI